MHNYEEISLEELTRLSMIANIESAKTNAQIANALDRIANSLENIECDNGLANCITTKEGVSSLNIWVEGYLNTKHSDRV